MSEIAVVPIVASPVRVSIENGGQLARLVLDRPKANVLDLEMLAALRRAVANLRDDNGLKLVVLEGAGAHFSFGASVPEHLPPTMRSLLPAFHALFRELEDLSVHTAAVVRGQCLGGALELAAWCGMVFCDASARLGVPEITLGVFPPVAAIVLPWRAGGARATRLIVTGEVLDADSALSAGLVDSVTPDPEAALQEWFGRHIAPRSAVALRYAWRAARRPLALSLRNDLPRLESTYLHELMTYGDPVEGLTAFLEKRPPVWKNV